MVFLLCITWMSNCSVKKGCSVAESLEVALYKADLVYPTKISANGVFSKFAYNSVWYKNGYSFKIYLNITKIINKTLGPQIQ